MIEDLRILCPCVHVYFDVCKPPWGIYCRPSGALTPRVNVFQDGCETH